MFMANNERVFMTRRYPDLPRKVLMRDSEISKKLIAAWDVRRSSEELLQIFLDNMKNLSDERYWETLRTVWTLCGKTENAPFFRKLMLSPRRSRYYFSSPEDAAALRALPEPIQVWRACNEPNDGGISWSINLDYVKDYQVVYERKMIIAREVLRKDVFALILRNMEDEIIIL